MKELINLRGQIAQNVLSRLTVSYDFARQLREHFVQSATMVYKYKF